MNKNWPYVPVILLLVLVVGTVGCPPSHQCSKEPHSRTHPFVFWEQADLEAVLAKITEGSPDRQWAKPIYDGIMASAMYWLSEDISVPDQAAGWEQDYVCPTHGVTLI